MISIHTYDFTAPLRVIHQTFLITVDEKMFACIRVMEVLTDTGGKPVRVLHLGHDSHEHAMVSHLKQGVKITLENSTGVFTLSVAGIWYYPRIKG